MDPETLAGLRAIVDGHRVRILGRLASRPADPDTLAAELRLPAHVVRKQLDVLARAGLVEARADRPGAFGARLDRVGELGRALAELERDTRGVATGPEGAWPHDGESLADTLARLEPTPEEARILRSYLVDGRLVTIPAQHAKRQIVLRFLLERVFTEDRDYPEKEVNQRIALIHPDVAALPRNLNDDRYVDREAGMYRRHGPRPEPPRVDDPSAAPGAAATPRGR